MSHIGFLQAIAEARIVGACDPTTEARERQRRAGFTAPIYGALDELLADPAVEALVICSPDRFHAGAVARGVAAGRHVLVEKPVADRREDLVSVTDALLAARENGLVVTSCHPRRFDPPFMWLERALPTLGDELGAPLDARLDFFYHRPSKTGLHHGLLIDHINHEIDVIHWLFGHSPFIAHKLADSAVRYGAAGYREDGLCFTFFGSRHLQRRAYADVVRVRFEHGEVEVDTEVGIATVRNWETRETRTVTCGRTDYHARFAATNHDFVNAARNATKPYLTALDLILTTELGVILTEDGRYDSRASAAVARLSDAR
jgi:predicted dehydrogenase